MNVSITLPCCTLRQAYSTPKNWRVYWTRTTATALASARPCWMLSARPSTPKKSFPDALKPVLGVVCCTLLLKLCSGYMFSNTRLKCHFNHTWRRVPRSHITRCPYVSHCAPHQLRHLLSHIPAADKTQAATRVRPDSVGRVYVARVDAESSGAGQLPL